MTTRPFFALAAALAVSACATSTGADVTRFHLGQPVARTTIALVPQQGGQAGTLEFRTYADAVAGQLATLGFQPILSPQQAELIGIVDFNQGIREGGSRGSGFSIGIGGGTFGRNVGVGGGVTIPIGKAKPNDIAVSTLSLQIKRRSDGSIVWEGRAVTEGRVSTPEASPSAVVPRLAAAMLNGFPGPSGQTVHVKL